MATVQRTCHHTTRMETDSCLKQENQSQLSKLLINVCCCLGTMVQSPWCQLTLQLQSQCAARRFQIVYNFTFHTIEVEIDLMWFLPNALQNQNFAGHAVENFQK